MVSALMPDDVRQLKAAGYGDEVNALLGVWAAMAIHWRRADMSDSQVWADVQIKLNELRTALRE
ncbi:unnamed protein product [marine sediment metagenome]|uniref:Uncharacterized protein n=1 Tax=marine sediment metagenome TaxID=412755 RepID=X1UD82_9ZZZZ